MKKAILITCLIILAAGCIVVAGCGSGGGDDIEQKVDESQQKVDESQQKADDSLQGVYVLEIQGEFAATVTLKADNEATYSLTESGGIPVTYKVTGDTLVLIGLDGKEIASATFKITDEGLVDPTGGLYRKQK